MDSVPTAISFHYQLSRFGDLTNCSKIVLYRLQQEIRDMLKNSETENDSNEDKSLYEMEKRLASLETAGRVCIFYHCYFLLLLKSSLYYKIQILQR